MEMSLTTVLEFFGMTLGVLFVIYIALICTPKIAKRIDDFTKKYRQNHPKPEEDERLYLVRGPFDGTHELDIDKLYEQEKARRELDPKDLTESNDNNDLISIGDVDNDG